MTLADTTNLVFTFTINQIYPTQMGFNIEQYKMRWLEIMFLSKPGIEFSC